MRRHVALVGLPGSGKSTVGPLAAARLGAAFVDLDRAIEARARRPIARIFEESGEKVFRALEGELFRETLAAPPCVVAAGGGLLDTPSLRRLALECCLVVYLETSPAVAATRIGDTATRPLLSGRDPAATLAEILERREPAYRDAPQHVTTDALTPDQVAERIAALARAEGGW